MFNSRIKSYFKRALGSYVGRKKQLLIIAFFAILVQCLAVDQLRFKLHGHWTFNGLSNVTIFFQEANEIRVVKSATATNNELNGKQFSYTAELLACGKAAAISTLFYPFFWYYIWNYNS